MFEGDESHYENGVNKTLRKVKYFNKKENFFEEHFYEMIHILEFDPNRKRMSVIVKDRQTLDYILFCKGKLSFFFNNLSKYLASF